MSLATHLQPMTLIQRADVGDIDDYGNAVKTETRIATTGALQQIRRDEPEGEGELSDTRWLLVMPWGTPLTTGDAVEYRGQVYELVGDPWNADDIGSEAMWHVEGTCRRTRTAGDEVGS